MNPEQFVEAIHKVVYRSTLESLYKSLERPAGRAPRERLRALSEWFNSLDDGARDQAREMMRHTADAVVFSMLTVLDGASAIDSEKRELELRSGGEVVNGEGGLHEHFRWLVDEELGNES